MARRAILVAALTLSTAAALGEDSRWVRVELSSGEPLTAQFVCEEPGCYVVNVEGTVLRIAKENVRKFERLSPPEGGTKSGDRSNPAGKPAEGAATTQDALRNAVESLGSPLPGVAADASGVLAANFAAARPHLHKALRHQNHRVRRLALKLLGERGSVEDDMAVISARLADGHPGVRRAAMQALRSLGVAGLPDLIRHLEKETEPGNRKFAVQTLKLWNDRKAVSPLVEFLAREQDNGVRGFIASALKSLTGQNLGKDAPAWQAYLAEEKRLGDLQRITGQKPGSPPGPGRSVAADPSDHPRTP